MIRTSRDVCKTDIHVSTLHNVPSQANAAKYRSADGLWEPRLYVIQPEPTGDFPGLGWVVANNLLMACKKWLAANPPPVDPAYLPTHWCAKWSDTDCIVIIDPSKPDGIDDTDRLGAFVRRCGASSRSKDMDNESD